jgi:hypothetical protein
MFIVRLKGGLGNQMFQYGAARTLAVRKRTSLGLRPRFAPGSEFRHPSHVPRVVGGLAL